MSVKDAVLRAINALPPRAAYSAVSFINARRRSGMYGRVRERVVDWHEHAGRPSRVMDGPFAGMRLAFRPITGPQALPAMSRYLGTYELEIEPLIEAIRDMAPDVLVDVGAADGYYAVGFARLLPRSRVIGFEANSATRWLLAVNARLNGNPGQLDMRGRCDPQRLEMALNSAKRPAVVCDVDGYEDTLLDPEAAPALRRSTILVEVHEPLAPGVSHRLLRRFADTHHIAIIRERSRVPSDKPAGCELSDEEFLAATKEYRDQVPGVWFFMRPRIAAEAPAPTKSPSDAGQRGFKAAASPLRGRFSDDGGWRRGRRQPEEPGTTVRAPG